MRLFERKGLSLGCGLISPGCGGKSPTALTTGQGGRQCLTSLSCISSTQSLGSMLPWLVFFLLYVKMEGWSPEGSKGPGSISLTACLFCCAFLSGFRGPSKKAPCGLGCSLCSWEF